MGEGRPGRCLDKILNESLGVANLWEHCISLHNLADARRHRWGCLARLANEGLPSTIVNSCSHPLPPTVGIQPAGVFLFETAR